MSKKSYKQLQNRLYREIKRRKIAEMLSNRAFTAHIERPKIETLKFDKIIPLSVLNDCSEEGIMTYVKTDVARSMCNKLIADGYITFETQENLFPEPILDVVKVRATLRVCLPESK